MSCGKLEEHGLLRTTKLTEKNEDTVLKFKKLSVEFARTTHSIPDTLGIAVHTPQGIEIQTGDAKFDLTPVGEEPRPNAEKMCRAAEEGVLVLMSDSTNAESSTFTKRERAVGKRSWHIADRIDGRKIFATFAQNMLRIAEAADAAMAHGRKIAVAGRSMETAMVNGRE